MVSGKIYTEDLDLIFSLIISHPSSLICRRREPQTQPSRVAHTSPQTMPHLRISPILSLLPLLGWTFFTAKAFSRHSVAPRAPWLHGRPNDRLGGSRRRRGGEADWDALILGLDLRSRRSGGRTPSSKTTSLSMAKDGEGGALTSIALVGILLVFLVSGLAPFLTELGNDAPSAASELANSVATRQDSDLMKGGNYDGQYERLDRGKIQVKLGAVPVFYLVNGATGEMGTDLYMGYEEAIEGKGEGMAVRATTLNQVM